MVVKVKKLHFNDLVKNVNELREKMTDLRPLFEQFAADFYKDQKRIFKLKGPGQYPDLSTTPYFFKLKPADQSPKRKYKRFEGGYKSWKKYYYGFEYPILFATGRLASSLLSDSDADAIKYVDKKDFVIGTKVPYAAYHNSNEPRYKMPYRPLWDESKGSRMFFRWWRLSEIYLKKLAEGAFK
jgi:phage gpG-like protein